MKIQVIPPIPELQIKCDTCPYFGTKTEILGMFPRTWKFLYCKKHKVKFKNGYEANAFSKKNCSEE